MRMFTIKSWNVLFVLVVALSFIVFATGDFPPEIIVQKGDSVVLPCAGKNGKWSLILWSTVDKSYPEKTTLLSHGYVLVANKKKFNLKYDPGSSTLKLQINKVQENDTGYYKCQEILLSDNKTISEDIINLMVATSPIIFENSTKFVDATEGQHVRLECYAGGYPVPMVSWFHDNHEYIERNVLTFTNVTKKNRGTYVCLAENIIGKDKRNVNIEVEFAPIVSTSKQKEQSLFHDMDLLCGIDSYPMPKITWWKDGIQLVNNDHYTISIYTETNAHFQTTLRIKQAQKQHFGRYECRASNKLGFGNSFVKFIETKDPVCPPACDFNPHVVSTAPTLGMSLNILIASFFPLGLHVLYMLFD